MRRDRQYSRRIRRRTSFRGSSFFAVRPSLPVCSFFPDRPSLPVRSCFSRRPSLPVCSSCPGCHSLPVRSFCPGCHSLPLCSFYSGCHSLPICSFCPGRSFVLPGATSHMPSLYQILCHSYKPQYAGSSPRLRFRKAAHRILKVFRSVCSNAPFLRFKHHCRLNLNESDCQCQLFYDTEITGSAERSMQRICIFPIFPERSENTRIMPFKKRNKRA